MPALRRTLVQARCTRTQATVPTHGHACPARLLPTFLSRLLTSGASNADRSVIQPGCGCGLGAKLPFSHTSLLQTCKSKQQQHAQGMHIHTGEASESILGAVLEPLDSIGLLDRPDHTVPHACNAEDSGTHSQAAAQKIRARCKGQKEPESLDRKISVLKSCEQVSPAVATVLRKSTAFKSASSERLAAVLKVLNEFLGSSEKACQALAANPGILYQPSELLGQKLTVLSHLGISKELFRKLCTTQTVLSRKLESLYKTLILLEEIDPSVKARNRLLRAHPQIAHSTGMLMLHAVDFFESLGMDGKEISNLLERRPSMFVCSVHTLIGYYTFFRKLGLSANEFTRATRAGFPKLALGSFEARVEVLKNQGFSDNEIHAMLVQHPAILGLRCDYLKNKLDFLLCEQKYDIADIVRCPVSLSLSLQNRLIPRLTAARERGLFKVYAFSTILQCKDEAFQKLGSRRKRR